MEFEVTFDYLCPFARNAAEAVLSGLEEGRQWSPRFRPFSLSQAHRAPSDLPVWEGDPSSASGVLALQWAIAVRDEFPERFGTVHRALFAARHDEGKDIGDLAVVTETIQASGVDPDEVAPIVASGTPLKTIAAEHTEAVDRWQVFGVPTFIHEDEAVFVRMMERGRADDLDRVLEMVAWARLNEFKRTRIPR